MIVFMMSLSPQVIDHSLIQSESTPVDPTVKSEFTQNETLTATPSATPSTQAIVQPTIEPSPESTIASSNKAPASPTKAPKQSHTAKPDDTATSDCQTGQIKGIALKGISLKGLLQGYKFYYEMHQQNYHMIDKVKGIRLVSCFDSKEQATENGFKKGPPLSELLKLLGVRSR